MKPPQTSPLPPCTQVVGHERDAPVLQHHPPVLGRCESLSEPPLDAAFVLFSLFWFFLLVRLG